MYKVDLNADLGESFGAYTIGMDGEVLRHISSANIACGFHAGDPLVMAKTVKLAAENGVAVGAHPGYPDLMGFGRRSMTISNDEARAYTKYQLGALLAFARGCGLKIQHCKPHGAFYNNAAVNLDMSIAICEAIYEVDPDIIMLGLAGSKHLEAAAKVGLKYASEVFADRGYMDDGTLVPRKQPGAMIHDEDVSIQRVIRMVKQGEVETITGKVIPIKADSICVHGDNPKAVAFVQKIRAALKAEGVEIAPISAVIA